MRYRRGMERMRRIEGRVTMEEIASVLRDHFEGWTFETADGRGIQPHVPGSDPHCTLAGSLLEGVPVRTICYGGTVGSMVCVSDPKAPEGLGGTLWACLHLPCLNAYVPFFPAADLRLPPELTRAGGAFEQESLWWRLAAVSRNLEARWGESAAVIDRIRHHWQELERQELERWPAVRDRAVKLAGKGKLAEARRLLADFSAKCVQRLSKRSDQVARWVPGFDPAAPPPAYFQKRY
jgi:dipeptidase